MDSSIVQWMEDLSCYILDLHFSWGDLQLLEQLFFLPMSTKFFWLRKLSEDTPSCLIGNLIGHQSDVYLKGGEIGFRLKAFCLFALFVLWFLFSLLCNNFPLSKHFSQNLLPKYCELVKANIVNYWKQILSTSESKYCQLLKANIVN